MQVHGALCARLCRLLLPLAMGLNLFRKCTTTTTTRTTTLFIPLSLVLCCCSSALVDGDRGLLRDLGLDALPDVTKVCTQFRQVFPTNEHAGNPEPTDWNAAVSEFPLVLNSFRFARDALPCSRTLTIFSTRRNSPVACPQVNISIDEYTSMTGLYLRQLKDSASSSDGTSIPKLYTFKSGERAAAIQSYFN